MNKIYKKLLDLRNENEYSQEFVANYIGVSRATYIKLEKGAIKRLDTTYLIKLSELYNISLDELCNTSYSNKADNIKIETYGDIFSIIFDFIERYILLQENEHTVYHNDDEITTTIDFPYRFSGFVKIIMQSDISNYLRFYYSRSSNDKEIYRIAKQRLLDIFKNIPYNNLDYATYKEIVDTPFHYGLDFNKYSPNSIETIAYVLSNKDKKYIYKNSLENNEH